MHRFIFVVFILLSGTLFSKELVLYVNSHLDESFAVKRWQPTVDLLNKKLPQHTFKLLPISPNRIDKIAKLLS
ncbi:MAG: hypothetical protein U9O56_04215 [Campylobacterota bacterium]|nr:hypothetical protein [Campylobacterota bacterium]